MRALVAHCIPAADDIDAPWAGPGVVAAMRQAIIDLPQWTDPFSGSVANGQGIYLFTPDGELLGWSNSGGSSVSDGSYMRASGVARMLRQALNTWAEDSPVAAEPITEPSGSFVAERNFLAEHYKGFDLILRAVSRDLPRPADAPGSVTKWGLPQFRQEWNLHYIGLRRGETRQLLPEEPTVGSTHVIPEYLVHRLAREYLIDNVHGTAPHFADADVQRAELTSEIVATEGTMLSVEFTGAMKTDNGQHGFAAEMRGMGTYDRQHTRWRALELVVVGTRHGSMHHSGRGPWQDTPVDPGPAPMGIVCTLVERNN